MRLMPQSLNSTRVISTPSTAATTLLQSPTSHLLHLQGLVAQLLHRKLDALRLLGPAQGLQGLQPFQSSGQQTGHLSEKLDCLLVKGILLQAIHRQGAPARQGHLHRALDLRGHGALPEALPTHHHRLSVARDLRHPGIVGQAAAFPLLLTQEKGAVAGEVPLPGRGELRGGAANGGAQAPQFLDPGCLEPPGHLLQAVHGHELVADTAQGLLTRQVTPGPGKFDG